MTDDSLLELIYKAHRELARMEEEPRDYGTGRLFYASEMHTLVRVGESPYMNLTTLADKLGVSKSAASKFAKKLLERGCIEKTRPRDNEKEVLFHVTPEGRRALRGHEKFQRETFDPLRAIESKLDPESAARARAFLSELYAALIAGRGEK
jgi:DNA-binding MarR family transcriptional regulator